jgi:hypothetical protein
MVGFRTVESLIFCRPAICQAGFQSCLASKIEKFKKNKKKLLTRRSKNDNLFLQRSNKLKQNLEILNLSQEF